MPFTVFPVVVVTKDEVRSMQISLHLRYRYGFKVNSDFLVVTHLSHAVSAIRPGQRQLFILDALPSDSVMRTFALGLRETNERAIVQLLLPSFKLIPEPMFPYESHIKIVGRPYARWQKLGRAVDMYLSYIREAA